MKGRRGKGLGEDGHKASSKFLSQPSSEKERHFLIALLPVNLSLTLTPIIFLYQNTYLKAVNDR